MRPGAAGKTPLWRVGSWLGGVALLAAVPFARGPDGLLRVLGVVLLGGLLTVPHGVARLRGAGPYHPAESLIRLKPVSVGTFLLLALLVRLPMALGDHLFTAVWRAAWADRDRRRLARRAEPASGRPVVIVPPDPDDDPTWPPADSGSWSLSAPAGPPAAGRAQRVGRRLLGR